MKHILFPTDFSENSKKPIPCLGHILNRSGAKLTVMHAMHVPMIDSQMPVNMLHTLDKEMERKTNDALKDVCKEIINNSSGTQVDCNTMVRMGFGAEEIIDVADNSDVDFVVMGTQGESGANDIIMGSITQVVIRKTKVPVLAVPKKCVFSGFQHMVFATELKEDEMEPVEEVIRFSKIFNSQLTLLHISEPGQAITEKEKAVMEKIRQNANYPNMQFGFINHNDVLEGLNEYIDVHKANIIAMATRKRNLFERIFDKSLTRQMAFQSHVPVLVVHK